MKPGLDIMVHTCKRVNVYLPGRGVCGYGEGTVKEIKIDMKEIASAESVVQTNGASRSHGSKEGFISQTPACRFARTTTRGN